MNFKLLHTGCPIANDPTHESVIISFQSLEKRGLVVPDVPDGMNPVRKVIF